MKALHPADPLTTASGIPDMSSIPTVFQNFSSSYTVMNPNPSLVGNWDFDVFFYPHPYIIGACRTVDASSTVSWSPILNPHIQGTTYADKRNFVAAQYEKFRLAYMGITGYQDAAALNNQGLIAVAQYPQQPVHANYVTVATLNAKYAQREIEFWPSPLKDFSALQNLPNAYFGNARDGCYAPFKLSETCQEWVHANQVYSHFNQTTSAAFAPNETIMPYPAPPAAAGPYGLVGTCTNADCTLHPRSDDGVIHISGKQFGAASSFTLYYRSGWEVQVSPSSTIASFAKTSPMYDSIALAAYYAISRELKDAYPADYNDLGKIVRSIADIAGPALTGMFPSFAAPIAMARGLIHKVFPLKQQEENKADTLSEAQKDRIKLSASDLAARRRQIATHKGGKR